MSLIQYCKSQKRHLSSHLALTLLVLGGIASLYLFSIAQETHAGNLLIPSCTGAVQASSPRLAVARTFCVKDAQFLANSFDAWDEKVPCKDGFGNADLYLVFSQSLNTSSRAQAAVEAVSNKFHATNGWNNCFRQIVVFCVNIEPEADIYEPDQQHSNPMWVNGPNRQFERTIRTLQSGIWGEYESLYLMERDSVPIKSYWLDELISDIEERRPTAILGSKYRGDKWDGFYSELPPALVNHINGNAVYNLTHPLLNLIVKELEDEASTVANSIPYDYRIAQTIEEGRTGTAPEFPALNASQPLQSTSTNFSSWYHDYVLGQDPIQETKLLGNYAATNMLPTQIGEDEVVVHGAKIHEPWNTYEMGDITLVVSDRPETSPMTVLESLAGRGHPFSEVVVAVPNESSHVGLPKLSVPVHIHHRDMESDFMDLCVAPVNTSWFMITDSNHLVRPNVQLMTHRSKPLASYAPANDEYCYKHNSCAQDMELALSLDPQTNRVFDNSDMVFHTRHRNDFCDLWTARYANRYKNGYSARPSATAYAAYLKRQNLLNVLYHLSDRTRYGSRSAFVPLPSNSNSLASPDKVRKNAKKAGTQSQVVNRGLQKESLSTKQEETTSNVTSTSCTIHVTREDCVDAECVWRALFGSCHAVNRGEVHQNVSALSGQDESSEGGGSGGGGFEEQPSWTKILIVLSIFVGGALVLALLGVGGYKKCSSKGRNTASSATPPEHLSHSQRPILHDFDDSVDFENIVQDSSGDSTRSLADYEFRETERGVEYVSDADSRQSSLEGWQQ